MFPNLFFPNRFLVTNFFPGSSNPTSVDGPFFTSSFFVDGLFPVNFFPLYPNGSIGPELADGVVYLWQLTYEGSEFSFIEGYPFNIAYLVSEFFGEITPPPGTGTNMVLVDSEGLVTEPISLIRSSTPPEGSQIVMARFPPMIRGSYWVVPSVELYSVPYATRDRIEVI